MLEFPSLSNSRLEDVFFAPRIDTLEKVTIPAAFKLCRETGRINAFKLDWKPGMPDQPHRYWDSDVAKVIEGAANMLALRPNPELEHEAESVIELIISAQQPDGYLNCYYTVVEPEKRWTELYMGHELYCLGHLIESAVAWFDATGKRHFMDAMCRSADLLCRIFGPDKKRGCPGHPELESALVRLFRATGERRYLDLSNYFLSERGTEKNTFPLENPYASTSNLVADIPLRQRSDASGHAVRLVYLARGMAEAGAELGDRPLFDASVRMWENLTQRRMYVTGGIGSCQVGETVTADWDLPLDRSYAESCAAMGLAWFSKALLENVREARFADILELELYNGAISGLGLDGESFFYANPQRNSRRSFEYGHVFRERQKWFNTSCCPTNYCRFISNLPAMLSSENAEAVQIHIIAAASYVFHSGISVRVRSLYPWNGAFAVEFTSDSDKALEIRIPSWCASSSYSCRGKSVSPHVDNGYAVFAGPFKAGDIIAGEFAMPVETIHPDPRIASCAGRFALKRGPVVYCCEECDNPGIPGELAVDIQAGFRAAPSDKFALGGVVEIIGSAYREEIVSNELYTSRAPRFAETPQTLIAVPYALWGNRHPGEGMEIWLRSR